MTGMDALAPISVHELYEKDVAYLKRYNAEYYKLTLMKSVRRSGFEERSSTGKGKKNSAGNTAKLDSSLSRTRSRVRELALCNAWEYFGTFTLSPATHDRFDIAEFIRSFSKWIQNINYRRGLNIGYLLVPEQHKDGAWHMHGVLKGIPPDMLQPFTGESKVPLDLIRGGYYNWIPYQRKFGFVSLGKIRCLEATAHYVSKYITKELASSPIGLNKHLYLCSKGLSRAQTLVKAPIYEPFDPDFANDYVAAKVFTSAETALQLFESPAACAVPMRFEEIAPVPISSATESICGKEVSDYGRNYAGRMDTPVAPSVQERHHQGKVLPSI